MNRYLHDRSQNQFVNHENLVVGAQWWNWPNEKEEKKIKLRKRVTKSLKKYILYINFYLKQAMVNT